MALIYFYDATEIDKLQLSEGLRATDHHWEYVNQKINISNCNPDAEVISVFVSSTVSAEIMDTMPQLKLIACRSTGFNNIDLKAAELRGITVVNVPTYGEHTVAEYAFSLLLTLTRRMLMSSSHMNTDDQNLMMGTDLAEKTIGILGTGKIGMNAVRIAKGFGMRVLAYDPYPKSDLAIEIGFEYANLDAVLASSDILSLHVPLTSDTTHMIDADAFSKMKRGVILVNTSRGELIDTSAPIDALESGIVAQAGLDVLEEEHLMSYHGELELLQNAHRNPQQYIHSVQLLALQKMPQVLLTPHNAFNTIEAIGRINATTTQNIISFWYGEVPNAIKLQQKNGILLIARHAESEWNALGKWTGTRDVHLSEKGFHEAGDLGRILPDIHIDVAYSSEQIRTRETMEGILEASGQYEVQVKRVSAMNERDYGDETGLNKWEVRDKLGEEVFNRMRREWNFPIPNGETLKEVYARVLPFYKDELLPQLKEGKNVLLVAHGNSIRALVKYIESVSDEGISGIEMLFGTIVQYQVDDEGKMVAKKEYHIDSPKPNA